MVVIGILGVVAAILLIAGLVMEKNLRAKYNGAVGLVNSYLFTGGSLGGIVLIVMMFIGKGNAETLIAGIVCLALAAVILLTALGKCPEGSKSVPGVIIAMYLVGTAASVHILGFLMKLVFHFDIFAGRNPGAGYSNWYRAQNGEEYQLWTANGSYAVLKGTNGTQINAYPHGNDGLLCDDSNNLYTPM